MNVCRRSAYDRTLSGDFSPGKTGRVSCVTKSHSKIDIFLDLGCHISKASLKGRGVLESKELNNLLSHGFYITKIIWVSVVNGFVDSNKF